MAVDLAEKVELVIFCGKEEICEKLDLGREGGFGKGSRIRLVKGWRMEEYILVSLDALPPEIFWTRSWPNSVLRSPSCFLRSSLLLPQSAPALTFAVDCFQKSAHVIMR